MKLLHIIFVGFLSLILLSEVFAQSDTDASSTYYEYYADGNIKMEIPLVDDQAQGKGVVYYPNGNVKTEFLATNSALVKVLAIYDEEGNLFEGYFKDYYENGKLMAEVNVVRGKPIGEALHYDINGKIIYKIIYDEGRVEKIEYLDE